MEDEKNVEKEYYPIYGFLASKKRDVKFTYCGNIRAYAIVIFW